MHQKNKRLHVVNCQRFGQTNECDRFRLICLLLILTESMGSARQLAPKKQCIQRYSIQLAMSPCLYLDPRCAAHFRSVTFHRFSLDGSVKFTPSWISCNSEGL